MRGKLQESGFGDDPDFRWRGGDVSRLEGFSDAVFGFALTLLVVSLEAPSSYVALMEAVGGFFAFAFLFLMLYFLWYQHYIFFRRYGLNDFSLVMINGVLMFLTLFFVYPAKFLAEFLINFLFFGRFLGIDIARNLDLSGFTFETYILTHSIYAGGFAALAGCYVAFYYIALKKTEELDLNDKEYRITLSGCVSWSIVVATALLSILLVLILPEDYAGMASGFIFWLIPIGTIIANRRIMGKGQKS